MDFLENAGFFSCFRIAKKMGIFGDKDYVVSWRSAPVFFLKAPPTSCRVFAGKPGFCWNLVAKQSAYAGPNACALVPFLGEGTASSASSVGSLRPGGSPGCGIKQDYGGVQASHIERAGGRAVGRSVGRAGGKTRIYEPANLHFEL